MSEIVKDISKVLKQNRPLFRGHAILTTEHLNYFKPFNVPINVVREKGLLKEVITCNPLTSTVVVDKFYCYYRDLKKTKYTKPYRVWKLNEKAKQEISKVYGPEVVEDGFLISTSLSEDLTCLDFSKFTAMNKVLEGVNINSGIEMSEGRHIDHREYANSETYRRDCADPNTDILIARNRDVITGIVNAPAIFPIKDRTIEPLRVNKNNNEFIQIYRNTYRFSVEDIVSYYEDLISGKLWGNTKLLNREDIHEDLLSDAIYYNSSIGGYATYTFHGKPIDLDVSVIPNIITYKDGSGTVIPYTPFYPINSTNTLDGFDGVWILDGYGAVTGNRYGNDSNDKIITKITVNDSYDEVINSESKYFPSYLSGTDYVDITKNTRLYRFRNNDVNISPYRFFNIKDKETGESYAKEIIMGDSKFQRSCYSRNVLRNIQDAGTYIDAVLDDDNEYYNDNYRFSQSNRKQRVSRLSHPILTYFFNNHSSGHNHRSGTNDRDKHERVSDVVNGILSNDFTWLVYLMCDTPSENFRDFKYDKNRKYRPNSYIVSHHYNNDTSGLREIEWYREPLGLKYEQEVKDIIFIAMIYSSRSISFTLNGVRITLLNDYYDSDNRVNTDFNINKVPYLHITSSSPTLNLTNWVLKYGSKTYVISDIIDTMEIYCNEYFITKWGGTYYDGITRFGK